MAKSPAVRAIASTVYRHNVGRSPPLTIRNPSFNKFKLIEVGLAACLSRAARRILSRMGSKSRETIYGGSVRAAAERATEARKEADRLAVEAWNKRMLGFQGPAQPSPTLGDAINAGFGYLEVK